MKEHTERKKQEHATSTQELVTKYEECKNPVTKAVYRSIIAGRLGIHDQQALVTQSRNTSIRSYLEHLTYSFEGRSRMREMFDLWFMK